MTRDELLMAYAAGRRDFREADLWRADLQGANLKGAILQGAILTGAILKGACLTDAKLPDFRILPEEGAFVVWKKLKNGTICKLQVEAKDVVCSLIGRKCRARRALVLEGDGVSKHDPSFVYSPSKTVEVDNFNDDVRVECAAGVHFFVTRREAEEY